LVSKRRKGRQLQTQEANLSQEDNLSPEGNTVKREGWGRSGKTFIQGIKLKGVV